MLLSARLMALVWLETHTCIHKGKKNLTLFSEMCVLLSKLVVFFVCFCDLIMHVHCCRCSRA